MTTALATKTYALNYDRIVGDIQEKLPEAILNFLDVTHTATDRATFYNSKGEQNEATAAIYRNLLALDRGIFGLCLLLPGVTDYARQMGIGFLLDNPHDGADYFLNTEQEAKALAYLSKFMEPQRLFKLYGELRRNRVNNSRTKKLILRSILMSPKLDYWAVKYRTKLRRALEHAWDKKTTGIIRSILGKPDTKRTEKERRILSQKITKYILESRLQPNEVLECVAFVLGIEERLSIKILKAYKRARTDLAKGVGLPEQNLFYLRSRFHKETDKKTVYEIAKSTMTGRQTMQKQAAIQKTGTQVEFDPTKADSVRLYVYAYEMGLDDKVKDALEKNAEKAARALVTTHKRVGILIDASESGIGNKTQALRPMAIALATRDMLIASADEAFVEYAGGRDEGGLVRPSGETALGLPLVKLLKKGPDAVYVFSDGYENAPAGEFAETMQRVRKLGITTPVYHVAPVMAAESSGVRELSEETKVLPINKPEGIGSAMLRAVLRTDVRRGLFGIAKVALPQLGYVVQEDI